MRYIYIHKIRNTLPGIDTRPSCNAFVSWSGKPMTSSLVGDQFNAFFKRAVNSDLPHRRGQRLTATLVQKSFVSKGHSEKQYDVS